MANYKIILTATAEKSLNKIPNKDILKIVTAIQKLAIDPRPQGCRKLAGHEAYRIRVGIYRIIYDIENSILTILILKIGHRKDVYK